MRELRKRLTYANVMSSLGLFLILGGATAFAATQLAKNSVGTKQLKKNAVTAAKIKDGAVTAAKIEDGAIPAATIDLATLGTVPNAARAASADTAAVASSLAGQTTFSVRLGFGQQRTVATNGAVSLVANCRRQEGFDIAEVLFQTNVDGAVAGAQDLYSGNSPAELLNVDTPAGDRQFASINATSGATEVTAVTHAGFVIGPDDKGLVGNSEGLALGVNYGTAGCLIAGVVNAVG